MTIKVFAPAKINLTLHVTGQNESGYHLLDSLVVFADFGDSLTLNHSDRLSLKITGPFSEGVPSDARNLVWRAAELAGWQGEITLEKNLPHGAGIGGGSSDAAAVLRELGAEGVNVASLGADVPVCLDPRAQRMQGIGDVLEPALLPSLPAVLLNAGGHVATPDVFAALHQKQNQPMPDVPLLRNVKEAADWLKLQRNDLEAPARTLAPQIGTALEALRSAPGALLARMSGSGGTCFALFETEEAAQAAAATLKAPGWWATACCLN